MRKRKVRGPTTKKQTYRTYKYNNLVDTHKIPVF